MSPEQAEEETVEERAEYDRQRIALMQAWGQLVVKLDLDLPPDWNPDSDTP